MKRLIILALVCLSGCSNKPYDKFIGDWSYSGSGKLLTVTLTCTIDLSITKKDNSYILSTLNLTLNPSVFNMTGGEFFKNAKLTIKDENTLITPKLPNGSSMIIGYVKDGNHLSLDPNPCNGISAGGLLNKK